MDNIEDFTDTSDVSDAAIEWVLKVTGSPIFSLQSVREGAAGGYGADRSRIIAARLVERHYPELLVDPVLKLIREEFAKAYEEEGFTYLAERYRRGELNNGMSVSAAKRIYMLGLEKGKGG